MAKELKEIVVADFEKRFAGLDGCVLIDYHGLDSEHTADLRSHLRQDGLRLTIVHNRLLRRALAGREDLPAGFCEQLRGPTAVLHGEEGGAILAAKALVSWQKKNRDLAPAKGGLIEGRVLSAGEVSELAKIPDRPTLLCQTAGLFLSPLQYLASATRSLLSHFAGCAKERARQLEAS
ncbi:MAG: 50S ribosomal protein L10 [Planctomycetes bacterium]|nr:50S ribosomal protein L10 [Planctomycetota bacterium]